MIIIDDEEVKRKHLKQKKQTELKQQNMMDVDNKQIILMNPQQRQHQHFQLIDTLEEAKQVCARLHKCRVVALDIEQTPIGQRQLSLLQIAVSRTEIYIFDVYCLGQELFDAQHLLPLLSDPKVLKLVYDCRNDIHALSMQHGVRVHGFYDLQIVYTSLFEPPNYPYLKGLHRAVARLYTVTPAAAKLFE